MSYMTKIEQSDGLEHLAKLINELANLTIGERKSVVYQKAHAFARAHTELDSKDEIELFRLIGCVCEEIWQHGAKDGCNPTITENEPYMAARKWATGRRLYIPCGDCYFVASGPDAEDAYAAHHAMTGH